VSRNRIAPLRPSPTGGFRDVEKLDGPSEKSPMSTKQNHRVL